MVLLNTFVRDLNSIKKRCISVYYPRGSGTETVDLLQKTKRDAAAEKIESAIEKRIVKLQKKPISLHYIMISLADLLSKIASITL